MAVQHRQVFFIGGFDPKSSPQYHRMYREAAQRRPASAAGEQVEVSKQREREGLNTHWTAQWHGPSSAPPVATRYTVMGWHDIVHTHWPRGLRRVLHDYVLVYGTAWPDGTFARLWRLSRASFWFTQFPLLLLLTMVGLGMSAGAALSPWLTGGDAAVGAGIALLPSLVLWREVATALDSEWLLRLLAFTHDQTHDQLPELEQRLEDWAQQLVNSATALQDQQNAELLLVGHSTGAMLAMSAMARALRRAPWLGTRGPALSLLTLGHSVPLLALQPSAHGFRQELAELARHAPLCWVDYSARPDWAAFADPPPWLNEPVQGLKQACSPRFHHILAPQRYHAMLRWHQRHALHLQYLRAPDRPGGYDFVTLTAGPLTLAEHHTRPPAGAAAASEDV